MLIGQPAEFVGSQVRAQAIAIKTHRKPTLIIDPVTGRECYTKHPEKLIERKRAIWESEQLKASAKQVEEDPKYWNGSPKPVILRTVKVNGAWRSGDPLHKPGEVRS